MILPAGPATYYGCSSGGHIALCLAVAHRELVRNVVIHEVAGLRVTSTPNELTLLSDHDIVAVCKDRFRNQLNESAEAWDALGAAFHKRLERNYVTWVRRYIAPQRFRAFAPDDLRSLAATWTVGSLSLNAAERFAGNFAAAKGAGITVGTLNCRHFPQVSIPAALAEHIARTVTAAAL